MDLWIRSQDKEKLVKINSLQYGEYQGTHYINGYCINEVDNIDLGIYATKERALEVLDEIQKILRPQIKVIHNKTEQEKLQDFTSNIIIQPMIEDIQVQQANCYVYEMPEE